MSPAADPATTPVRDPAREAAASAKTLGREQFAGSVLVLLGLLNLAQGAAALKPGGVYSSTDYAYAYDLDAWGWGFLVLGVVVGGIGLGLLLGQEWARILGILVALFSALANFMLIPQMPVWALFVIALDVLVVWELTVVIARSRPA
jgi:hypothetical protein